MLEFWSQFTKDPVTIVPDYVTLSGVGPDAREKGPEFRLEFQIAPPGAVGGGLCVGGEGPSCGGQFVTVGQGAAFPATASLQGDICLPELGSFDVCFKSY